MSRYFLELAYKGTNYSGFQSQINANTVQAEVENAFETFQREKIIMTGSSRTDAGVHALQNYFHFDFEGTMPKDFVYKFNAILPSDIVVKNIMQVNPEAHCRFDAVTREYNYYIYRQKDPFLKETAFYFPYKLDIDLMQQAAAIVKEYTDFTSFSKRNTQVKTFICQIQESNWLFQDKTLIYNVKSNRFLRGMVRALTATMLKIGRDKLSLQQFRHIIEAKDCTKASFAVPAHGLFLIKVNYDKGFNK
ncbi:MAG: tRNA pseudouridine(38-40) synthase TruA [Chitinophagaceae bacterium]|nr:tRNA pseudouridine(38-40) synthase TruA [Chitinophagaceae bacterium]MBK8606848.1 tRNA pseudouridine(38-40) synthase TruA [Chitinophagaceae bacterium]MBP6476784.1 tRNA pseudouridine(38-40) synthase TruA [Chitinophagaceae bacterium]MBP7108644.1 tRNA pseudouridine(38-40) synthase TruA [Chitinophagaceae bacterium]MBP7314537.1 tRNA pseudouridine(38-40) synthase TruA [Chitinophagaceae bacterium]